MLVTAAVSLRHVINFFFSSNGKGPSGMFEPKHYATVHDGTINEHMPGKHVNFISVKMNVGRNG